MYGTSENNVGWITVQYCSVLHTLLVPSVSPFQSKLIFFGIVKTEQYNNLKKHVNHVYHPKNVFVDKKFGF